MMLLAGDIGGTKTNLALFSSPSTLQTPVAEATFPSAKYASLTAVVSEFLSAHPLRIDRACFGVAGPVLGGRAKITNLPWVMEEWQLQQDLGIPAIRLLNDLEAMANAIPLLTPADLLVINHGVGEPHGTLGVIAPGTGLGEAFLTWENGHYRAHSTEGGHTDFGPTNLDEIELLRYLLEHDEHVSYEDICSGMGLPKVYTYLKDCSSIEEHGWISEQLAVAKDPNPIIIEGAMNKENPSPRCVATVTLFASVLGAEAGNLALKVLSSGGVYIGGGIPPRIIPFIQNELFMQAFCNKGRFREMLSHFPVYMLLNPKLALLGAAAHGFDM